MRKTRDLFKKIRDTREHLMQRWAQERREVKGKGEKEGNIHLKVEFQRIARRDKKDFLSDQCKEIEENNREKTRDLRHNKGQKWYGPNRSRRY